MIEPRVSLHPSPFPLLLTRWLPLTVLLLALLVRGGALLATPDALRSDPDGYRRLAENLVAHGTYGTQPSSPLPLGDKKHASPLPLGDEKHLSPLPLGEGQGEGVPTAYRPPLYPLLLAGCVALGDYGRPAIGVLHVALGVATVSLVLVLGRQRGLGRRAAALAALLVACDPILLMWSTQVMTETLAVFLATAGLVALTWAATGARASRPQIPKRAGRPRSDSLPAAAMLAGATLALGALCRPTLLLWTIVAGVVLCVRNSRGYNLVGCVERTVCCRSWCVSRTLRLRLRQPLAFALGVLLVLSPWAIRNQFQFGRPIVTTTHGGYTLLLANNPEFYHWLRDGRWGSVWQGERFNADWDRRRPRDEVAADRMAYDEAWQTIRREPATFAYSCLVRLGRFWSPLPHRVTADESPLHQWSRWAVAMWYTTEFFFAALGLAWCLQRGEGPRDSKSEIRNPKSEILAPPSALRPPPWLWGLLLVLCLSAVHTVYWSDMRMRAPLMPVVALAAAAGVCRRKSNETTQDQNEPD